MKESTRLLLSLLDADKLNYLSLRLLKSYLDGSENDDVLHLSNALCCASSYIEKLKSDDAVLCQDAEDKNNEDYPNVQSHIFLADVGS